MKLGEVILKIRQSETERAVVIKSIFKDEKLRSGVEKFVMRNNGNRDDASLVFDDMIVQFIKTVFTRPDLRIEGDLNSYLMGIAKHLWYAELRQKKIVSSLDPSEDLYHFTEQEQPESLFLTNERRKLLEDLLNKLRTNCRDVLMHWANGFSMEEIAQKLNYQSEGMARKKKSICFRELLEYLERNPHLKIILAS